VVMPPQAFADWCRGGSDEVQQSSRHRSISYSRHISAVAA
jgi:hypothetical protein